MGWLRTVGKWLGPSDAAVNWAVRLYLLYILGISTIVSSLVGVIAWIAQNFVYGVWAFFGTWILLTILQAIRTITRSSPEAPQAEPKIESAASQPILIDTDSRQALEAKIKRLESTVHEQQERLNRFDGDRKRFKALLTDAWREGTQLRESDPSEDKAQEWKNHVRDLLEAALGEDYWVNRVLGDDPTFRSQHFGSSTAQKQVELGANRLYDLSQWVGHQETIEFRSGFDPYKWKDWKSPPPTESQEPEKLRAKLREAEQELDLLRTLSPEEVRIRQGERRKRIHKWHAAISNFDFSANNFANTDTYSEMKPHARLGILLMIEWGMDIEFTPRRLDRDRKRRMLLEEVARLEKKWGLI